MPVTVGHPLSADTVYLGCLFPVTAALLTYSLIQVAMLGPGPAELLLRSHKLGLCWVLLSGPLSGLGSSMFHLW